MSNSGAYDDQNLPWLEPVEDEDSPRGPSARKMLMAFLLVLAGAAVVAATFFWIGRKDPSILGAPEIIAAEPGPYKVKPENPGGLDVAGESETAFSTSAGEDPDAQLDVTKLPGGAPPPLPSEQAAEKKPEPVKKPEPTNVTETPAPTGAAGPTVQLGAYASTVKADTAWNMLSSRFPEVKALNKSVVTAQVGGKTMYRLRATGSSDATRAACAALKSAGESCLPVN